MTETYHYSSISALNKLIQTQTVSPVEIVTACLQRIEALNPKINACLTVMADLALEQAPAAEAEIKAGLGVKRLFFDSPINTKWQLNLARSIRSHKQG